MRARVARADGFEVSESPVDWKTRPQTPDWESALSPFMLVDEAMPIMLAYADSGQRYRYHNRAFREWVGLEADQIDGHTMREVLGESVYAEIATRVREVFAGCAVRYERTQRRKQGGTERLFIHLVPRVAESGQILGMYALLVSLTRSKSGEAFAPGTILHESDPASGGAAGAARILRAQQQFEEEIDVGLTGWENAADRLRCAIRDDEFQLYARLILDLQSGTESCYEIYLRMNEEEENMMPPGAFYPLAEKYGLLGELDRWVVRNVLKTIVARIEINPKANESTFCINLSRATISDPDFSDYVRSQLTAFDVHGEALRFEIQQADVLANPADASQLVQELARLGCWSILCGFGRDRVSFDILKDLPVGFLKIDSSIILKADRDESALAMLRSINRVAHTVGINTIAEFVETPQMVDLLREIGIDYAQGLINGPPLPISAAS